MNNYFIESVENLEVERNLLNNIVNDENLYNIDNIINKFHYHPSILKINENVNIDKKFHFKDISDDNFFKILTSLDPSKGRMKDDFPTEILLGTSDIICKPLNMICNDVKKSEKFPSPLKTADITPLPKDREKGNKKKYRPVSLTPMMSKIFEKDLHGQISN